VALAGLYARRWTFYIDEGGRIRQIDKNVDVATAGQDIARNLETLGFPKANGGVR
jgi:peroxiredoxin